MKQTRNLKNPINPNEPLIKVPTSELNNVLKDEIFQATFKFVMNDVDTFKVIEQINDLVVLLECSDGSKEACSIETFASIYECISDCDELYESEEEADERIIGIIEERMGADMTRNSKFKKQNETEDEKIAKCYEQLASEHSVLMVELKNLKGRKFKHKIETRIFEVTDIGGIKNVIYTLTDKKGFDIKVTRDCFEESYVEIEEFINFDICYETKDQKFTKRRYCVFMATATYSYLDGSVEVNLIDVVSNKSFNTTLSRFNKEYQEYVPDATKTYKLINDEEGARGYVYKIEAQNSFRVTLRGKDVRGSRNLKEVKVKEFKILFEVIDNYPQQVREMLVSIEDNENDINEAKAENKRLEKEIDVIMEAEKDPYKDFKRVRAEGALIAYNNEAGCEIDFLDNYIREWNHGNYHIKGYISIDTWDKHKDVIKAFWNNEKIVKKIFGESVSWVEITSNHKFDINSTYGVIK